MRTDVAKKQKISRSEAKELSRRALLDAGIEELADSLLSPVANVKSSNVAERAGLTTGAFYHHWETQEAFQDELRSRITHSDQVLPTEERVSRSIGAVSAAVIRMLVRAESDDMFRSSLWRVQLAMLAGQVPEDVDCARNEYEVWASRMADVYAAVIDAADLELRPGVTAAWLSRSISAIVEGFGLQRLAGFGPKRRNQGWREVELAVAALLVGALRPKDAEEPNVSIPEALDQLLP